MKKLLILVVVLVSFSNNGNACSPFGIPILDSWSLAGDILTTNYTSTTGWACNYNIVMEIACMDGTVISTEQSACISKPSAANLAYPSAFVIDLSGLGLCPGETYQFRAKESNCGSIFGGSAFTGYTSFVYDPGGGGSYVVIADNDTITICAGDIANLGAEAFNNCGPLTYFWDNGGGAGSDVTVSPATTTTYTVTATQAGACGSVDATDQIVVVVTSNPVGGIATAVPIQVCEGGSSTITLTGSVGNIQWQSGPTAIGPWTDIPGETTTILLTGPIFTTTFYQAVVSNVCGSETSTVATVTVYPDPIADFSYTGQCQSVPVDFTDETTISSGSIASWDWDFDDASPNSSLENPSHLYAAAGFYNVTLTVTSDQGCTDDTTITIEVLSSAVADFSFADNICEDIDALFNDLSTVASGAISTWEWNFGDGSPLSGIEDPSHTYPGAGTYTVTLVVSAGSPLCADTMVQTITLQPLPIASFTVADVCQDTDAAFFDATTITSGTYSSNWDFDDAGTSTLASPTHTYASAGLYNVTLTITSTTYLCTDVVTLPVNIWEMPTAVINSDPPIICNPGCVNFYDGSFSATTAINVWNWDFEGGGTSTSQNPTPCYEHQSDYTEYYNVTLTVWNSVGCSDMTSAIDYVAVEPTPVAEFTYSPQLITIEDTRVSFTNSSEKASTYLWNFSDDSPLSTVTNPEHIFPEVPESYLVELKAYSASGTCKDSISKLIIIKDVIIFYVPNVFTPDGDEYNETFQPIFVSGYDPYEFHMAIFNRWGEIIFETFDAKRGWDGTYGSRGLVQDGTYVWAIEFRETMSDKKHKHKGHVTILK